MESDQRKYGGLGKKIRGEKETVGLGKKITEAKESWARKDN